MREGEPADCAYVLVAGRLRAAARGLFGQPRVVGEVGPGEFVGEMGLLSAGARTATVVAVRDSDLLVIPGDAFADALVRRPEAAIAICRTLVQRLRRANIGEVAPQPPRNLAIIRTSGAGYEETFLRAFAAALSSKAARVARVNARAAERFFDGCEPAGTCTTYFHALERDHAHVLYETGMSDEGWARRCLDQADTILVLADDRSRPGVGRIEPLLREIAAAGNAPRIELVMLGEGEALSRGKAAAWLDHFGFSGVHRVLRAREKDVARVARLLTHRATGAVLGGGGARGIAHLGVLKALHEGNVELDVVAGTSFGALAGAAVALDWDAPAIIDAFREALSNPRALYDYTLPVVSLVSGAELTRRLRKFFGEHVIEDLQKPFFCVSSSLSRGIGHVHRRGTLWRALRASVSIPGVFPPVAVGDDLLVDGALINNFPVELMREAVSATGLIYASDVSGDVRLRAEHFSDSGVCSGLRVLANAVSPARAAGRQPGLISILTGCATVAGRTQSESVMSKTDVCFRPPVQGFGLLEWQSFDRLIEVGYRHACETLAAP